MADKTWKAAERRIAALFGGERVPLSGGNSKITRADVIHPRWFVECKYRKKHGNVSYLLDDVLPKALKEKKRPILVLVEKGRRVPLGVVPLKHEYLYALADELRLAEQAAKENVKKLEEGEIPKEEWEQEFGL